MLHADAHKWNSFCIELIVELILDFRKHELLHSIRDKEGRIGKCY